MEAERILVLANLDLGLYKFRKELLEELLEKGKEVHIALPYGELVEPLIQKGCKYQEVAIERRCLIDANRYRHISRGIARHRQSLLPRRAYLE